MHPALANLPPFVHPPIHTSTHPRTHLPTHPPTHPSKNPPTSACIPRDGLKAELKLVREDVHRITLELRERQLRAERLAAKFDSMSSKGRATEEGGEPKSQAYYIIKVRPGS